MKNFDLYIGMAVIALALYPSAFSKEKSVKPLCAPGVCNSALKVFPPLKSEKRYILWPANANLLEKIHVYDSVLKKAKEKKLQNKKK